MSATPASQQQFCVRWNSHLGSLGAAFPQLLAGQRFVDVTLACEGHQLHCHRLVLAACSSYFESLLSENPCKHPIIIMPHDIKLWEIQALVDFMYKGEVNVSQAGLPDLLRCAEVLQIRGLCGSDAALNLNSVLQPQNKDTNVSSAAAAVNTPIASPPLHSITTAVTTYAPPPSSSSSTTTTSAVSTLVPAATTTVNNVNNINNISTTQKLPTSQINSVRACVSPASQSIGAAVPTANGNKRAMIAQDTTAMMINNSSSGSSSSRSNTPKINKNITQHPYTTSTPNNTVTPKLEPADVSMEDNCPNANDLSKVEGEEPDYMEGSGKQPNEKQLHHPTQTQQHLIENFDEQIDDAFRQENENYKQTVFKNIRTNHSRAPMLDHDYDEEYNDDSNDSGLDTLTEHGKLQQQQHQQHEDDSGSSNISSSTDSSTTRKRLSTAGENSNAKRIAISQISRVESPASIVTPSPTASPNTSNNNNNSSATNQNLGKIRVKSDENLYENYSKMTETTNNSSSCTEVISEEDVNQQLPPHLKFNKDEMTIFVKKPDAINEIAVPPQLQPVVGPMIQTVRSLASPSLANATVAPGPSGLQGNSASSGCSTEASGSAVIGSSSGSSPIASPGTSDDNTSRSMTSSICCEPPEIGDTTTVKTELDIVDQEQEDEQESEPVLDGNSSYENIVCSPSVHDYNSYNNDEDDDEDDDDDVQIQEHIMKVEGNNYGDEQSFDDIKLDEAYGGGPSTQPMIINPQHLSAPANIPTIIIPTLATYTHSSQLANSARQISSTTHIARVSNRPNVLKNAYLAIYNKATGRYREVVGQITVGNGGNGVNSTFCYQSASQEPKIEMNGGGFGQTEQNNSGGRQHIEQKFDPSPNPSPSAVVLRNPRSNQPRSYSTEALYAALMDVKAGESIYSSTQENQQNPPQSHFALSNVICEYDGGLQISMDNVPGRRVRRSEAILTQAAECVSRGQTFQTVSDMFNIPISTIRFFMARKGILPRRKRGRAAGVSIIGPADCNNSNTDHSRSVSPSEPPFHFANYKLPEIKPRLL